MAGAASVADAAESTAGRMRALVALPLDRSARLSLDAVRWGRPPSAEADFFVGEDIVGWKSKDRNTTWKRS